MLIIQVYWKEKLREIAQFFIKILSVVFEIFWKFKEKQKKISFTITIFHHAQYGKVKNDRIGTFIFIFDFPFTDNYNTLQI